MLKAKTVFIFIFLFVLLPLWIVMAWLFGIITIGTEPVITKRPAFEQTTSLGRAALSFCLGKDYSERLALFRAGSPPAPLQTTRLRNRPQHVVVDVTSYRGTGSIVRVFKTNDTPLSANHLSAIQSCIPQSPK